MRKRTRAGNEMQKPPVSNNASLISPAGQTNSSDDVSTNANANALMLQETLANDWWSIPAAGHMETRVRSGMRR